MGSVGIDLLEIDRLERALARRPRLAERLFTTPSARTPTARARPAMHLAARFCAKEAVAKALALERLEPARRRGRRRGRRAAGGAACRGTRPRAPRELGGSVAISLTHTRGMAGAVAVAARMSLPRWLEPLPDAELMRGDRRVGDRDQGHRRRGS